MKKIKVIYNRITFIHRWKRKIDNEKDTETFEEWEYRIRRLWKAGYCSVRQYIVVSEYLKSVFNVK